MKREKMWVRFILAFALGSGLGAGETWALGIRQPEMGAAATGQNDAFVAQADDPSAVYYNPAGLTQLTGTELLYGVYINGPRAEYDGRGTGAGTSKKSREDLNLIPHFYAVSDLGTEPFRFGLGVFTPFGQAMDWGNNNSFRYVTTRASLSMVDVNPTVAYRVNEMLSVAAGYDFYYCETDLRRAFPFVIFAPLPTFVGEGNFRFQGRGEGHGYNLALFLTPHEKHRFGISYRSAVDVEFDGRAKVNNIPGLLGLGDSVNANGHAQFTFPDILQLGYAFWPTPKWKIEVNGDWTHWDVVNDLALKSKRLKTTFGLTNAQMKNKLNWEDSWIVELGTQYELKENLFLRGGWYWSQDSIPDDNFSPFVPDSDRTGFSVGFGLKRKQLRLDLAYQFNLSMDRDVKNNVGANPFPPISQSVNGHYQGYSHGGAVSVGWNF